MILPVTSEKQNTKVYIEIVKQLREMIKTDGLKSGDKIPSERELTERLNVGRSSVREALRALELLGLIETRRGEGTFIRDFKGHHLVQLLGTFILQDEKVKHDVIETKHHIEMVCLQLLLQRIQERDVMELKEWTKTEKIDDDKFFQDIIEKADNHLLLRIWQILKDYYRTLFFENNTFNKGDYYNLLEAIETKNQEETLVAYRKLRKLSTY